MAPSLVDVAGYLDGFLRISETPDHDRALNGLQVERDGVVRRLAAAVDACQASIEAAVARGADLMLVHHGLFWGGLRPLTGRHGRRVRTLLTHGVALYAAHLPLDRHPEVGNNAVLAGRLELSDLQPFGHFDGIPIGFRGACDLTLDDLSGRLAAALRAPPRVLAHGPRRVRRVAVVSGAGASTLDEAAGARVDTLVTGEAPHHAFLDAEELGVNLILGGHYATETFGVQALAVRVGAQFGLPWDFVDHPTGL